VGRELKRVPLDFKWPINKTWEGYLNPFSKHAIKCCKQGYSKEGQFLHDSFYSVYQTDLWAVWTGHNILAIRPRERLKQMGWDDRVCDNIDMARQFGFKSLTCWGDKLDADDIKALVDDNRLYDFTQTWTRETGWKPKDPAYMPTPDEVNAWSGQGMGHDAINCGILIKHRCKKIGVNDICEKCEGTSRLWPSPEVEKQHADWTEVEPPKGDGYQLWQSTSEGSPITPVFKTMDELCLYAADHCTTFGSEMTSAENWKKMLEKDFVHHQMGNAIFI
jgi:hypothetical protein